MSRVLTPVLAGTTLSAVTGGLSVARDPALMRSRFEEELRALVRARTVLLRDDPSTPAHPGAVCLEIPAPPPHHRARLEAVFEPSRMLDGWTCQLLETATHVAAMTLEIERAYGRTAAMASARGRGDGAAPLIGSSRGIRMVRERIERVAATDFTVLIEGAIGPESHPDFIGVFNPAALCDCHWTLERAGEDAAWGSMTGLTGAAGKEGSNP